jgi:hypothetical protein
MGTSRWDPEDWDIYASRTTTKSATELFGSTSINSDLDPKNIVVRESCDSTLNPLSTPIIVAVDETGSMGMLAETLIRNGLGVLIEEIYDRKPVTDPHVMCMAFGDCWFDRAPLQVTQFETDIRLADQLSKFYIEGNGGGNGFESYNLPWYFAATRTKCDAFLKRNKKGYLFTVGDEPPPPNLLADHVKRFLGGGLQRDLSTRDVLTMASKTWTIFHIMIEEGNHYRRQPKETLRAWREVLGENAIPLSDHTKLAELIVSIIEVQEGRTPAQVAASWSGGTALAVTKSLLGLKGPNLLGGKGMTRL